MRLVSFFPRFQRSSKAASGARVFSVQVDFHALGQAFFSHLPNKLTGSGLVKFDFSGSMAMLAKPPAENASGEDSRQKQYTVCDHFDWEHISWTSIQSYINPNAKSKSEESGRRY
jgi:hypothetical protein